MGESVGIFGGGILQPRSEITFPINPTTCLFITRWAKPERMPMTAGWVRDVNRRTARIAGRYVIAPYRTTDVDAVVHEARASYGEPKIDPAAVGARYRAEKERERSED
jgi:hypothetical protein